MDKHDVIRIVSDLSSELASSMLIHLEDVATFVSDADVAMAASIEQMANEEKNCLERLAQLLDSLDAVPGPPRVQAAIAAMPYNEVHVLVPRLIKDKTRLVDRCKQAASMVTDHPAATECIAAVTHRHSEHLDKLNSMRPAQAT
ncbi:MAG: hypothetical protein DHS20C16_25570 [Phycisphaerae bacterium]|nr:MAG: hypothetical protein DHS20C16_25570 [Phycisphaerae bacterium]